MGIAGIEALVEAAGEDTALALAGLAISTAFGFLAQRSRFCLRSAVTLAGLWTVEGGASMRRRIVGAMAMGFGGMLAGGCAVGAGLSGAAAFTITSWVALCAIWAAATLTDRWLDQHPNAQLNLGADPANQAVPGFAARA
jgi:uncharacterized membrane protein YedE/YeeE